MTDRELADEVLAHSEDVGEWEETPVEIERRPSGTQVVSARLPAELAQRVIAEAEARGTRLSEVIREAVEAHLTGVRYGSMTGYPGRRLRLISQVSGYETENPVVTEAPGLVASGAETLA